VVTLQVAPNLPPKEMEIDDDVWCFLFGEDSVFPVNTTAIRARKVAYLKYAIAAKRKEELARNPDGLKLYRVAIDEILDRETRINKLSRLSVSLQGCTVLDEMELVSAILRETPPPGHMYIILVRPPEGEWSIHRWVAS